MKDKLALGKQRSIKVGDHQFDTVAAACIHFGTTPGVVYSRMAGSDDLEWVFGIKERTPLENRRKALSSTHNLAAAAPRVASEWDQERNGMLQPNMVTPGSGKRVWWVCSKDSSHKWEAIVKDRAPPSLRGCPFCAGKRASGVNRLSDLYPHITAQYAQDLNDTPLTEVTVRSGKRFWWRCNAGHTWRARPADRVNDRTGCALCLGRQAHELRNLATDFPALIGEYDYERNFPLIPEQFTPYSGKKVWWRCPQNADHLWQAAVAMRTKQETGCPYCRGLAKSKDNCLATLYPAVSRQWHPTKNGLLKPDDVVPGSSKRVWWRCKNGVDHEWQTAINKRALEQAGCPFCSGQRLSVTNRLDTVRPDISKLLVPELNPPEAASKVYHTDSRRNLWFRCATFPEHVFQTRPYYFTVQGGQCPICRQSRLEQTTERILKEFSVAFQRQWRSHTLCYKKKLSFDFYLPEHHAVIECDGEQHFVPMRFDKGPEPLELRRARDRAKNDYCKKQAIPMLRIRFDEPDITGHIAYFLEKLYRTVHPAEPALPKGRL